MTRRTPGSDGGAPDQPGCLRCEHFYVTWDPRFPRGCRALGFKGRELPSAVVRAASGLECLRFEPRRRPRRGGGSGEG